MYFNLFSGYFRLFLSLQSSQGKKLNIVQLRPIKSVRYLLPCAVFPYIHQTYT